MPKMNVAFSLDKQELDDFDEWRSSFKPPLARGPALVRLLRSQLDLEGARQAALSSVAELRQAQEFSMEQIDATRQLKNSTAAHIEPQLEFEKKEELPLIRSPESKAAALASLQEKLAVLPDVKGIHERNHPDLEKKSVPDPDYYDEYDQGGER